MIFKDNKAYYIKNETRNKTNTKNYSLLNGDFVYEVSFKPHEHNEGQYESSVLGRTGYCIGVFTHHATVKWTWFKVEGDSVNYDSIIFSDDEDVDSYRNWWYNWIEQNSPGEMTDQVKKCLYRKWAHLDNSLPYVLNYTWPNGVSTDSFEVEHIENEDVRNWVIQMNEFKEKTSYLITEIVKVKVVKKGEDFLMYINDVFYMSKKIGQLYDYSNETIFVGVGNPYSLENNPLYYNGEIYEVKIYHDSIETKENLYLWLDFQRNSNFKTFDKSGNGNHGEIFETEEEKERINIEFNKSARPQKIV